MSHKQYHFITARRCTNVIYAVLVCSKLQSIYSRPMYGLEDYSLGFNDGGQLTDHTVYWG